MEDWHRTKYIQTNSPVTITFNPIFEVKSKEETKVVEVAFKPATPDQVDTPIKKLICDTWGPYECLTAVAVSMGEGLNHPEDGFNVNTNGTIDVGPMRINSVHFTKPFCSLQEVVFFEKNIKCAYYIWDISDPEHKEGDGKGSWEPWVAYWSGSYKQYLAKLEQ